MKHRTTLAKKSNLLFLNKKYSDILENIIEENKDEKKTLLLHACCAPCSSYVLEYLSKYFDITIYYYNPNIDEKEEFDKRVEEVQRLLEEAPFAKNVKLVVGPYEREEYKEYTKGLEDEKEGGKRCMKCYYMRLLKACLYAKENNFDYFTTTLSISPYKNAYALNNMGKLLSKKYGINYLYSDFKKKNGYKRSIELSHIYKLYRQDYCGCNNSKIERENYVKDKKNYNG